MNTQQVRATHTWKNRMSRCAIAVAASLTSIAIGYPALSNADDAAPFDATPDDNVAVAAVLGALAAAHGSGVIGGIVTPGPPGVPFEQLAFSSDVALRNTPSMFVIPPPVSEPPNAPVEGSGMGFDCVYEFEKGVVQDVNPVTGNYRDLVADNYSSFFLFPIDPVEDVFGDLGKPFVYHPQADVGVSVLNRNLSTGSRSPDGSMHNPQFPIGRHELLWEATTTINYVLDIAWPALALTGGLASEIYGARQASAKVAAGGTREVAGKIDKKKLRKFKRQLVQNAIKAGLIPAAPKTGSAHLQWLADNAEQWLEDNAVPTATNRATGIFTVWDDKLPSFRDEVTGAKGITEQVIELEATDFGGVRFGRVAQNLRGRFKPEDPCTTSFDVVSNSADSRLFTIGGDPQDLVWAAREINGGPYRPNTKFNPNQDPEGESVVTYLTQKISVVDTQAPLLLPPAGFARVTTTDIVLAAEDFPLGRPRVVDLADPSPEVGNDAPAILRAGAEARRYEIKWWARDHTGNETMASPGNPEQYTQIVTLKPSLEDNTAPEAFSTSAAAIASTGVEVLLTGNDDDLIDGRFDPLKFEIEEYPTAGQFVAPLLPHFVDDFRLSSVGEREEGDNLTRVSPLKHLADEFRLANPMDRGIFLNDHICNAAPDSADELEFNGVIPVDFVYAPSFVYVDDQNFYYLRDYFWVCGEGQNEDIYVIPEPEPVLSKIPRLSKWTDSGEFVAMRSLYPTLSNAHDNTNLTENFWPEDKFTVDDDKRVLISADNDAVTFNSDPTDRDHFSFDNNLGDLRYHGRTRREFDDDFSVVAVATDASNAVIYELQTRPTISRRQLSRGVILVNRYNENFQAGDTATDIGTISFLGGFVPSDMKLDSDGFIYATDSSYHRVHKFSPTVMNESGEWVLGEHLGWMGRCSANMVNDDNVPYSACDEVNQVSIGFECTDKKCEGYGPIEDSCCARPALSGKNPGQFNNPQSIAIGPGDILYVADTGNSRVQRFGSDGTFAGEARSTGTGINQGDEPGFILGNMGMPDQVSVNATSFYVLERDEANGDYFVHVYKTTPFYDLTDNSAKIEYVSHFDFNENDSFRYYVDDGIARSPAATVNLTVTRAFTAPDRLRARCFADSDTTIDVPCTINEDTEVFIRLSARDRDGFVSTGGYDSLSFEILESPLNGILSAVSTTDNAAVYRYTPAPNFNGSDTLTFRTFDGSLYSSDDRRVDLAVTAVPDPVTVTFADNLKAAHGFPSPVIAEFSDVDGIENLQPSLARIEWGDGSIARRGNWANSGHRDLNGREISPQMDFGRGMGMLIASHNYDDADAYSIRIVMDNAATKGLPPTTVEATISVQDVTVVTATLTSQATVNPAETFPFNLTVSNLKPASWEGLEADNVRVAFDVPEGLEVSPSDSRCSGSARISCNLGLLKQDESTVLNLSGRISLENARNESAYPVTLEISDAGPKLQADNVTIVSVAVSDEDADGVIDFDDAFIDDPRYATDTDGDGLADRWEIAFGFDPLIADDTAADSDGDGFTLLEEFENGSFANLAEFEQFENGTRLESPNNNVEDRFGLTLAGGDLNLDGYSDLLIGSSTYNTDGGVFISYGGTNGASTGLQSLQPLSGERAMGRAIAIGDWDNNGYPDIAIASNDRVAIHLNNGEVYETPDLFLAAANGSGSHTLNLLSADLDGDLIDDLIVKRHNSSSTTSIEVYGSTSGGFNAPPVVLPIDDGYFTAYASGDIDGDGAIDLVLGEPGTGKVRGYRAKDNSWTEVDGLTTSFEVSAVAGQSLFGHRLASGSDVTGDGIDDLVIGAYGGVGRINLYSSQSAYWRNNGAGPIQTIAGNGKVAGTSDTHPDQFGVSIAMGHLDSDGYADLAVGSNRAGAVDEGQVRILRGGPDGFRSGPQIIDGTTSYDLLGHNVAIVGDMDGDGFADVAGGASDVFTAQNQAPDGGYVQLLYHSFAVSNPAQDIDGDGVRAGIDNCPSVANTNQSDIDDDGRGDVCDSDIDGDGINNGSDNCPTIHSLDQRDTDRDTLGDVCDPDDDNDGVEDADDAFPRNRNYSMDSDGDRLPDAFEIENNLDENDASDAAGDLDGDGRSNLEEFREGKDINVDDVPPDVVAPANIVVDSTGPRTAADLGTATATDVKDGARTAVANRSGPFPPGRNFVRWSATDEAGNEATATQRVDVIPQLGFVGDTLYVPEGAQSTLLLSLNGDAVKYPVTVPYTVSGTASRGSDYTLTSGDIVIDNSNVAAIQLRTLADNAVEGQERLVITLGKPDNAIVGNADRFRVLIAENNLPPMPELAIEQNGRQVTTVTQDRGPVIVSVATGDPDKSDSHVFRWNSSDNALVPQEGFSRSTFTFDPSGLDQGVYRLAVTVSDTGTPERTARRSRFVRIVDEAPDLTAGVDTDVDGIPDVDEGLRDSNNNGTSDYLDPSLVGHHLVGRLGNPALLQTSDGYMLALGRVAMMTGDDALVSMMDVANFGDGGQSASEGDDTRFAYPTGIYDFDIRGLPIAGHTVSVVIPQSGPIPSGASYRKFVDGQRWVDFTVDENNAFSSAPGVPGVCPAPGSNDYQPGLNAGDHCVQLLLEDGGLNDADGSANNVLSDPGGVAVIAEATAVGASAVSVANKSVFAGDTDVVMLRFRLSSNSSDVVLNDLTFRASGGGNDAADIQRVMVWVDANADGAIDPGDTQIGTGSFGADNGELQLQMATPYRMDAGVTEFIVSYDF